MYVALNVHVVIVRSVLDFRKDSLNGDILIGHNEFVVLYFYVALYDLPLLEVVAVIALGGENYLGACDSIGCGCGSGAVLISQNNDLVLCGEYGLNFNILVGHYELVVLYFYLALYDLPLLESIAFLGGSGEGYLFAVQSLFLVGGSGAAAVGCDLDAALLDEDNSDNDISVGHDELVARYSDLVDAFFNDLLPAGFYNFGADGKMTDAPIPTPDPDPDPNPDPEVKNGIVSEDGELYYYVNGVKTYAGLIQIDGDYYYVNSSCKVVTNQRYWISKTNDLLPATFYNFGADGKMVK